MTKRYAAKRTLTHAKAQAGYTIMELLITVAIITIVASIALPSYQQHVMRSHRGDAMTGLLKIAKQQEKFYLQNNTYTTDLAALGVEETNNDYYTLEVSSADTDTFVATATIKSSGAQKNDSSCKVFQIDGVGMRTASNASGDATGEKCWR